VTRKSPKWLGGIKKQCRESGAFIDALREVLGKSPLNREVPRGRRNEKTEARSSKANEMRIASGSARDS
jgi:hypothetical protein